MSKKSNNSHNDTYKDEKKDEKKDGQSGVDKVEKNNSQTETDITPFYNYYNVTNIAEQIRRKTSHSPYFATEQNSQNIITDQDHFPYTRYFRGVAHVPRPIIMEREAGWRPINNQCYLQNCCDNQITSSLKVDCAYR